MSTPGFQYTDTFDTLDQTKWEVLVNPGDTNAVIGIENGQLNITAGDYRAVGDGTPDRVRLKAQLSGNISMVMDVKGVSGYQNGGTIIIFGQDDNGIYFLQIGFLSNKVSLGQAPSFADIPENATYVATTTLSLSIDTTYSIQIDIATDGTVTVYINGVMQLQHTFTWSNFTPTIQLSTMWSAKTLYDNFNITADSGTWEQTAQAVAYLPQTATALVSVGATGGQGQFSIVSYPSSISVLPNETFTIIVTVQNNGSATGNVLLRLLDHNGSLVDSAGGTIDPGQTVEVQLSGQAPASPGTYQWQIMAFNTDTNNVDDTKQFTVNVQGTTATATVKKETNLLPLILIGLILVSLLGKREEG